MTLRYYISCGENSEAFNMLRNLTLENKSAFYDCQFIWGDVVWEIPYESVDDVFWETIEKVSKSFADTKIHVEIDCPNISLCPIMNYDFIGGKNIRKWETEYNVSYDGTEYD